MTHEVRVDKDFYDRGCLGDRLEVTSILIVYIDGKILIDAIAEVKIGAPPCCAT